MLYFFGKLRMPSLADELFQDSSKNLNASVLKSMVKKISGIKGSKKNIR